MAIPPIPPQAENYYVIGITAYTEPVTMYQFQPHAHLRGKDFTYAIIYPDGREATVLRVPKYDFNWQLAYELDTPLKLPAGSKLVVTAHYDNSLKNKYNPGPEKEVYFREENQSWDEMFTPFIQYTIDSQDLTKPAKAGRAEKREENVLDIAEVVGCLDRSPSSTWTLTSASDPIMSKIQATSSVALKAAAAKPLGNRRYQLLGVSVFNPSSRTRTEGGGQGSSDQGRRREPPQRYVAADGRRELFLAVKGVFRTSSRVDECPGAAFAGRSRCRSFPVRYPKPFARDRHDGFQLRLAFTRRRRHTG